MNDGRRIYEIFIRQTYSDGTTEDESVLVFCRIDQVLGYVRSLMSEWWMPENEKLVPEPYGDYLKVDHPDGSIAYVYGVAEYSGILLATVDDEDKYVYVHATLVIGGL